MNQHPIIDLVDVAIKRLSEMVDGNTTIGKPITMENGTVILPISKVSVGFASGGSDIPTKVVAEKFGGGSGAGVSVVPVAFLVCTQTEVKLLQLADTSNNVDRLLSLMPEMMDKVNTLIQSKTKPKEEKKTSAEHTVAENTITVITEKEEFNG